MSSPIIWVLFPFVIGMLLLVLRRFEPYTYIISIICTLFLAYLAWSLPFEESINLIPWPRDPIFPDRRYLIFLWTPLYTG